MVKHIVIFKLKNKEDVAKATEALRGMKGRIEGLVDIEVGQDFLHSPRSFDIVLTCTLVDRKALDTYQDHPVHQPVKKLMRELYETSASVDYEC